MDVLEEILRTLTRIEQKTDKVLYAQRYGGKMPDEQTQMRIEAIIRKGDEDSKERIRKREEKISKMTPEEREAMEARKREGIRKGQETLARKREESRKKADAIRE
ncbi:MAG: hypothetical protein WCQ90_13840, partial [Deltaproteobacteria bacterium]